MAASTVLTLHAGHEYSNGLKMASRRKAAAAANAAITASTIAEGDEKIDDQEFTARDDAFQPDPPKTKQPKRAKKSKLAVSATHGAVIIRNPAPIDRLPFELRHQVLSYLDSEPYTILCLLTVSKVWYLTLMSGKHANAGWERRCRAMGATRKSKGCRTYHDTFINLLHKKCIICFKPGKFPIGQLLLHDFKYLMACEEDCDTDGPFSFDLLPSIAHQHEISCETLRQLPSHPCPKQIQAIYMPWDPSKKCPPQYRKAILRATKAQLLVRREANIEGCPFDATLLSKAMEHSRKELRPVSSALNNAVMALELTDTPTREQYSTIIDFHSKIREAVAAIRAFFAREQVEMLEPMPEIYKWHTSNGNLEVRTWIDAILLKEVTLGDYLRFLRTEMAKQDMLITRPAGSDDISGQDVENCITM